MTMKHCKYLFVICGFMAFTGLDARAADTAVAGLATTKYVDGAINSLGALATKNTIAAADIDANAVTTAKIANNNVTKAKLENSVQTSLGKADTALQKTGTLTEGHLVKVGANGALADGGVLGTLAAKSKVTDTEIDNGTISQDKISGLTAALNAKQTTANIVTEAEIGANKGNDTKYPSMKAVEKIAQGIASENVNELAGTVKELGERVEEVYGTLEGEIEELVDADTAINAKIGTVPADKTVVGLINEAKTAATNSLQGVSGGAAVAGKVATAVVKSGTNVSVTMGYVKIPVGSATAPTSVADIWVQ